MLPTIYHDVETKFGAGVQCEIQEQSLNDKDHPTSNTEQNMSRKRLQQESQEHNTIRAATFRKNCKRVHGRY